MVADRRCSVCVYPGGAGDYCRGAVRSTQDAGDRAHYLPGVSDSRKPDIDTVSDLPRCRRPHSLDNFSARDCVERLALPICFPCVACRTQINAYWRDECTLNCSCFALSTSSVPLSGSAVGFTPRSFWFQRCSLGPSSSRR